MLRRLLKLTLKATLVLLVLAFLFLLAERWRGQFALARYKSELAAKGESLDWTELVAPPVSDADNGLPEILRAKGALREGKVISLHIPPRMKIVTPGKAMVGFRESFWTDDKTNYNWAELASDVSSNQPALRDLRAALAKPGFDSRMDYSKGFKMPMSHLASGKTVSQWLAASCELSLQRGEHQAALDDLLAANELPRVMENDCTAIGELVRLAISGINFSTTWELLHADGWSDEQLARLQRSWEEKTFETNMVRALRLERAVSAVEFKSYAASNEECYDTIFSPWKAALYGDDSVAESHWWQNEFIRKQIYCRIWRFAWRAQNERFYFEGMQRLIEDHRTGAERATDATEETLFGLGRPAHLGFYDRCRFAVSADSMASLQLATVKSARAETDRSMALCAIALKRYELRHGRPASDLAALVPELLPAVPLDHMDGKPMKYQLNPDGTWRLYSVGNDGLDGGGDPTLYGPSKLYYSPWRGKDVVWPSVATAEEIAAWRKEQQAKP